MTPEPPPVRHVPARDVPVPAHLSPEAQAMLSLPPLAEAPASPALDDKEGWWARTAVQDEMVLAALAPRAEKIDVDVEDRVVDGDRKSPRAAVRNVHYMMRFVDVIENLWRADWHFRDRVEPLHAYAKVSVAIREIVDNIAVW